MLDFSRCTFQSDFPGLRLLAVLFVGILLILATASPATAQLEGMPVEEIRFEGLVSYQPAQIIPRLETGVGQPYNPLTIRQDLETLAEIVKTASVNTEATARGGVIVEFVVSEFPRFNELQVVGNQELSTTRIETLANLDPGESRLDSRTLQSIRRAIRTEYQQLGYPQAEVTLNAIPIETAEGEVPRADLQIVVDEGRQIIVDDVIIEGNQAYSGLRLRGLIDTKGSWGFIKNYYDEETFEEDLKTLKDFYTYHGYFDAVVRRGSFEERADDGRAIVSPVIVIEEGERYRFGEATVRGARLFSPDEVAAPFEPLEGELFNGRRFAGALEELQGLYRDHGLLLADLRPEYHYDPEAQVMNMLIEIDENERIYVGKVRVQRPPLAELDEETSRFRRWYDQFSPPVKNEVIMREILLEPGEIYNKRLERDSVRRLARLGVFTEESLAAANVPTDKPGVHDMVIQAEQGLTGTLSGGVGFGDAPGAFIFFQFNERNVGGEANVFSLQGTLGTRDSSLSISYLDRHIGDSRDSLLTNVFYQDLARPGYRADTAGASVEWGHPLAGDWRRYLRWRVEGVDMSERAGIDAEEDLDRAYAVATMGLRFEEDTRIPFGERPREGYLQSFGVELGYAGGPLARFEAARNQYVPLTERLTWRWLAQAGMMPYDRDLVPIHERYFLGGNADMRGFDFRGAGYFDDDDDDVPIGGAAKVLIKNELLFPIYDPISGVLFADVGALGETPVNWEAPRLSTGMGLRFDFRRFQVAIDLAAPLATGDEDETRFLHFSLESEF